MKIKFDHVHLNSADVNGAADFYVEKFGGKRTGEVEVAGTNIVIVNFGETRLLISDKAPSLPPAGSSVDHIGFRVDDLDAVAAQLKAKGAEFLIEPMNLSEDAKIAFVVDPDSVMIELSQQRKD
jgi:lactoylglutathione lyase